MTLNMADSISAASLPAGYDSYAGYVDGAWPDFPAIAAKFPDAHLYSISATGQPANEYDVETGDLSAVSGVAHVKADLAAGKLRPGIYASASAMASQVLPALASAGVPRASVRLRSAHYGAGEHICGPATCKLVSVPMDGTQWTDSAPGVNGALIDASVLADDFFTLPEVKMFIQIPGIPGDWLQVTQLFSKSGTEYVVGIGADGFVWMTRKAPGGSWTTPVTL